MYKSIRKFAALLLAMIMVTVFAAGCGSSKPTADDAKAYVQAVMDLMCTGDYDHSVKLSDVEEGKETETRDNLIDAAVAGFESAGIDEETKGLFKDYIINALGKAKYTVGDAVEAEDGGFDVTVAIEPLRLFDGVQEEFMSKIPDSLGYSLDELAAMSEEELNKVVYTSLIGFLNTKLDDPQYDAAKEVTVHYGLLEEDGNVYGVNEADGNKLGSVIFSNEGM